MPSMIRDRITNITSDGGAKGRNGYFKPATVVVFSGSHRVWLSVLSKRSEWPGPAHVSVSADEAREIGANLLAAADDTQVTA